MTDHVIMKTNFSTLKLTGKGKVRDIYTVDPHLLIVTTDRISAFDVIMPNPIPGKGVILTKMSAFWFAKMSDIIEPRVLKGFRDYLPDAESARASLMRRLESTFQAFGFVPSYPVGASAIGPEPEPWELTYVGVRQLRCAKDVVTLADPSPGRDPAAMSENRRPVGRLSLSAGPDGRHGRGRQGAGEALHARAPLADLAVVQQPTDHRRRDQAQQDRAAEREEDLPPQPRGHVVVVVVVMMSHAPSLAST